MPAAVLSSGLTAAVSSSRLTATASHDRLAVGSAWIVQGLVPGTAILELLILDDDGDPILDVTGQYLIGG